LERNQSKSIQDFWSWEPIRNSGEAISNPFGVAIDMPAGPSELLIVADDSSVAAFVASDLLSQAEHGADSQVILVSTSQQLIDEVENEIEIQLDALPRKDLAVGYCQFKIDFVENDTTALALINEYGPEHFIICTQSEEYYSDGVYNAGSVL
jgi:histidinol dehydrogenase